MNLRSIVGLTLIVLGLAGLLYGGFSYVEESHGVDLGPVELQVQEKEHVNIPAWAGAAAVVAGGLVLAVRRQG